MESSSGEEPHREDQPRAKETPSGTRRITLDILVVAVGFAIALSIIFYIHSSDRLFYQPRPFLYWLPNYYNLTVTMNLYSTTFAAQSEIEVYVNARPIGPVYVLDQNRLEYREDEIPKTFDRKLLPENILIYFFDSNCARIPSEESERYSPATNCNMTLSLQGDDSTGFYYRDKATIWYPSEGTYNVLLTAEPIRDDFYVSSDNGLRIIRIGALPSTESYENTKTINMTTTLVAYVAIVSAYFQGRSTLLTYVSQRRH